MIVVSDTSPISALLTIGEIGLLRALFNEVIVPEAVRRELLHGHNELPNWIRIGRVADSQRVRAYQKDVDPGEAEAIQLAIEIKADYLLIDERKGRRVARREGVRSIGLIGIAVLAKDEGLISSVAGLINRLRSEAGIFVSEEVVRAALEASGEEG